MDIKILGMGCAKCKALEENTKAALQELGIEAEVEKVQDLNKIIEYVMITPALVINEEVKVAGRVATKDEIKKYIEEYTK
ncbi:thioredoxin family protein [Thermoanaerobacter brockii subsp. lactiethylicus]|uniref:Redox-active disulfide protein 2 n=5 Tax=Thermoanaerobacteraceae TaxID=186814 RepID=B0K893_THEP3|nr:MULTISPECIES: thioredoxin family protein [Thermoanaerobacteraceae]ABY94406.1 redox-active disulfide protein 2 [Thermoanaerobacter pseudethanolicus ATCC 33223]ADV79359.1 redox-active disulfide protein 2 [Thermoanaerobacter brockii subsp. finnii Ako-1]MBT1279636.1 TM0996/MTH895 family glutaredoxin-like protein [Thermoanaerobacter sp. CM-CNRG TB177]HBT50014.1 thioredoxin family protein [Caldanaerobacter subterraneus]HBW60040.1 thioredoxin family protein [Thermoanaerobacter sp.]